MNRFVYLWEFGEEEGRRNAVRLINVQWSSVWNSVYSACKFRCKHASLIAAWNFTRLKIQDIPNLRNIRAEGKDFSSASWHPTIFPYLRANNYAFRELWYNRERKRKKEDRKHGKGASFHRVKLRGAENRTGGQEYIYSGNENLRVQFHARFVTL